MASVVLISIWRRPLDSTLFFSSSPTRDVSQSRLATSTCNHHNGRCSFLDVDSSIACHRVSRLAVTTTTSVECCRLPLHDTIEPLIRPCSRRSLGLAIGRGLMTTSSDDDENCVECSTRDDDEHVRRIVACVNNRLSSLSRGCSSSSSAGRRVSRSLLIRARPSIVSSLRVFRGVGHATMCVDRVFVCVDGTRDDDDAISSIGCCKMRHQKNSSYRANCRHTQPTMTMVGRAHALSCATVKLMAVVSMHTDDGHDSMRRRRWRSRSRSRAAVTEAATTSMMATTSSHHARRRQSASSSSVEHLRVSQPLLTCADARVARCESRLSSSIVVRCS